MQESLGTAISNWVISAFRTFAVLPFDLQIEPFVSGAEAQSERLIIKVEIGNQYWEADEGYNGTMTITFKTVERDAAIADDKWAKAEAALFAGMQTAGSLAAMQTLFQRICFLTNDASSSLDNTDNFRRYTRTIPLQVKPL